MSHPPVVLSIAGFDPSSGAGVTADIKTIAAHGCYGTACITALTVQSTQGVRAVVPVDPELIRSTLRELDSDLPPAAVKIGMLGAKRTAEAVAGYLERNGIANVVLDPVLRSSTGADLLDAAGLEVLLRRMLPCVAVITPNLEEAAILTGAPVSTLPEMRKAAARLRAMGARAVVVKGGHLGGDQAIDVLVADDGEGVGEREFSGPRLTTRATHGTGCAFAAALACHLALGRKLPEAVLLAKQYVYDAMQYAYELGAGAGPLHHLYYAGPWLPLAGRK